MSTDNIIPFPSAGNGPGRDLSGKMRSVHVGKAGRGIASSASRIAAAIASQGQVTTEDRAGHVNLVVRTSIRHGRSKGVTLDSLPLQLRLWLLDLCEEGEPTCLVVRDWLLGNRRYLSSERATNGDVVGADQQEGV